jgi:hypothetical protein
MPWTSAVPIRETDAVLLPDEMHRRVGKALERAGIPDTQRVRIFDSKGASTDHDHARWIPRAGAGEKPQAVMTMVVWVPSGLQPEDVAAIISLSPMSWRRGSGYEVRGFLPVWHRKNREPLDDFLAADVSTELRYATCRLRRSSPLRKIAGRFSSAGTA